MSLALGVSSQVIQQIRMLGKTKEWANCLLNAKRVSARLPKNRNLQSLFAMRFSLFITFLCAYTYLCLYGIDLNVICSYFIENFT